MPQYNVPQFVEVEDKILGPLTLKQFLTFLAGGMVVLVLFLLFDLGLFFWFASIPVAIVTAFVALGRINGRPVLSHLVPLFSFVKRPKRRFFKRESSPVVIKRQEKEEKTDELNPQEVQSKLKRLAYVLDQKSIAQEELTEGVSTDANMKNQQNK